MNVKRVLTTVIGLPIVVAVILASNTYILFESSLVINNSSLYKAILVNFPPIDISSIIFPVFKSNTYTSPPWELGI